MSPKFQHTCERCIYLGSRDINPYPHMEENQEWWVDFYICPDRKNVGRFSLVARDGDGPHEYESLTIYKDSYSCYEFSYEMELCLKLAKEKGIL